MNQLPSINRLNFTTSFFRLNWRTHWSGLIFFLFDGPRLMGHMKRTIKKWFLVTRIEVSRIQRMQFLTILDRHLSYDANWIKFNFCWQFLYGGITAFTLNVIHFLPQRIRFSLFLESDFIKTLFKRLVYWNNRKISNGTKSQEILYRVTKHKGNIFNHIF